MKDKGKKNYCEIGTNDKCFAFGKASIFKIYQLKYNTGAHHEQQQQLEPAWQLKI